MSSWRSRRGGGGANSVRSRFILYLRGAASRIRSAEQEEKRKKKKEKTSICHSLTTVGSGSNARRVFMKYSWQKVAPPLPINMVWISVSVRAAAAAQP